MPRLARTLALPREAHRLLQRMESPERRVEICCAQLDAASPEEIAELARLLDEAEHARAAKFRFERDRHRFIVAHGLLRLLLSKALERSAGSFTYDTNGKPALAGNDGLQFNLSHSADLAVFALSRNRAVGIDLELAASLTRNLGDLPAMAARTFCKQELAAWRALTDEPTRTAAFLRAWTRKEACLKAAGLKLDDVMAIETGFAIASSPQEIIVPSSRGESALRLILHDLSVPILPLPATAATACALAVEID